MPVGTGEQLCRGDGWGVTLLSSDLPQTPEFNTEGASSCRVGLLVHPRGGKADMLQGFLKCLDRASPKKRDIWV